MIRIGVCDDEETILIQSKEMLEQILTEEHHIETFLSPIELNAYMQHNPLDIIILDIALKNENGIQIAKEIQERYSRTAVIFITGFIDYAEEIFDADPVYFLVKPVKRDKLISAITKAMDQISKVESKILTINSNGHIFQVDTADIICMESVKRHIILHMPQERLEFVKKLDEIEAEMADNFIRCHQSYMVNIDKIKKFSTEQIEMCTGAMIPVSRTYRKKVKEQWFHYLGERL